MLSDLLVPFVAVGLAELGDKTQLAVFCLASKTKNYLQLLLGAMLGFLIADGLAIILGDILTKIVPLSYIKLAAGIIFIVFGIITLIKQEGEAEKCDIKHPLATSFWLVLVSEMGDKTQIASGLFAAEFNPIFVFIGVMSALFLLSLMAVYLGGFISTKVNRRAISVAAGILFILIGTYSILSLI